MTNSWRILFSIAFFINSAFLMVTGLWQLSRRPILVSSKILNLPYVFLIFPPLYAFIQTLKVGFEDPWGFLLSTVVLGWMSFSLLRPILKQGKSVTLLNTDEALLIETLEAILNMKGVQYAVHEVSNHPSKQRKRQKYTVEIAGTLCIQIAIEPILGMSTIEFTANDTIMSNDEILGDLESKLTSHTIDRISGACGIHIVGSIASAIFGVFTALA